MTDGAFCRNCGARLATRAVEGRDREVCPVCGAVAYRNPLPVAAVVLLDGERRALLVKRKQEPQAGMWSLPGGFAELGETIDQAAVRELQEETGPFGLKGAGEIGVDGPLPVIANAVADACGIRIFRSPMTAERVLMALKKEEIRP